MIGTKLSCVRNKKSQQVFKTNFGLMVKVHTRSRTMLLHVFYGHKTLNLLLSLFQSRQLIGVIAHLLHFSSREESIVKECAEWKVSIDHTL